MRARSLFEYIRIGGILEYLKRCGEGTPIRGEGYILDYMNILINIIEKSDFYVTKEALGNFKRLKGKMNIKKEDQVLTVDEQENLFNIMNMLIGVVVAESRTKFNFSITEKRIDVKKLLNDTGSLFAKDVFDSLPDKIQYDFKESGKCIAFECPTASAFHVLRGLEGVLRILLNNLSPQIDTSQMNWGPVITELKNLNISDLSILLDNLDRIRANYRNPTNHPEKIYNIEEVQDLFNLCEGVVNDITGYMKDNGYI